MSKRAQALLREALTLPPEERADVAAQLLASLDDSATEDRRRCKLPGRGRSRNAPVAFSPVEPPARRGKTSATESLDISRGGDPSVSH
ncbi:MAG: hypothetical protein ACREXX_08885 [Gammaproteobacteria bacterium]